MRDLQLVPHYTSFVTANAATAYDATAYACLFCDRIYTKRAHTSMCVDPTSSIGGTVCCSYCKLGGCVVPLTHDLPREVVLRWLTFWNRYGFTRTPHDYVYRRNRFVWYDKCTRTPRRWVCYDDPEYDSMLWVAEPFPHERWCRTGVQMVRMQRQYPDGSYGREWMDYREVDGRDVRSAKARAMAEEETKEEEEEQSE